MFLPTSKLLTCLLASSIVISVVNCMYLPVGTLVGTVGLRDMRLVPKARSRLIVSLLYVVWENILTRLVQSRVSVCWVNKNRSLIDFLVWLWICHGGARLDFGKVY